MANFQEGNKVTWIKKMTAVPHPEGKIGLDGRVLSVFRDTLINGRVISEGINNTYWVRPESAESYKDKICGERYYDVRIHEDELTLVQN